MTISVDLKEFLLTRPEIQKLVEDGVIGSSPAMPQGYIFEGAPAVHVDTLSNTTVLVISRSSVWSPPPRGNFLTFPQIQLEIWAAPRKDEDGNFVEDTTDDLIDAVTEAVFPYVHLVHRSSANGAIFVWNGTPFVDSEILDGPTIRNVRDGKGVRVGSITIGVQK